MAYDASLAEAFPSSDVGFSKRRNYARLLLRDTKTSERFSDDEINSVLAATPNVYAAASELAEALLSDRVRRKKVGLTDIEYYNTIAPKWAAQSKTHKGPLLSGS